jgi:hypothetical protein
VPKKKKIVQDKNEVPLESSASSKVKVAKASRTRRATAGRKSRGPSAAKNVATTKASKPLKAGIPDPSDEAVRLRAYFICERRRRFALPGDAESDWLEAKRQLLSEVDGR